MKILYLVHQFYPDYYAGTEKFVLNQAAMMQKFGHKTVVMTYSFYQDTFYDKKQGNLLCKEFVYKGIPVMAIRHKTFPEDLHHALHNPDVAEAAEDLIGMVKPDIVHIGHSMHLGGLIPALSDMDIPYIMTLTDFFLICPKFTLTTSRPSLCQGPAGGIVCRNLCPELNDEYIKSRLAAARILLGRSRMIAVPSFFHSNLFNRELPEIDTQVVPHGMNYNLMKRNQKKYQRNDPVTFCFAGSLVAHKGISILIEAFEKVRSAGAVLKIYGSGPDQDYVRQLIAEARKDERIKFCGVYSMEEAGSVFSGADMVIVPSMWYENYPLVLHEALACNVPVIASDAGGMAERITHGVNGFLVKMGDRDHLTETLQKVVDDPSILNLLKQGINCMTSPAVEQEAYIYEKVYRAAI